MGSVVESDSGARPRWQSVLREQKRSGLSIAEFCSLHGISASSFFRWKRMLQHGSRGADRQRRNRSGRPAMFLPVQVTRPAVAEIEIQLPDGTLLRLGPSCDESLLARVLTALEHRKC